MRRLTTALLVGGVLVLTLVATPAAGAQSTTDGNETAVGVEIDTWTVTGLSIAEGTESRERTRQSVAANLSVPADNVLVQPANGTAEVFGPNLSTAAIADGFAAAGFSPNAVRQGATDRTRANIVRVLQGRLDMRGSNATAKTVTVDGIPHVVVTGANRTQVGTILRNRGQVEVIAHYPVTVDGQTVYRETKILENEDFVRVGPAVASRPFTDRPTVEVFLSVQAAREAAATVKRAGFADEGVTGCPADAAENPDTAQGYCLYTEFNGEIVSARSLGGNVAWAINFQEYDEDPSVFLIAETVREAERLSATLRSGAFPAPVSVTRLSESVRAAALGNEDAPVEEPVDTPDAPTTDTPIDDVTPGGTPTDAPDDVATVDETNDTPAPETPATGESTDTTAPAGESTSNSTGVVTVTDATGPGFSPATALVALVLATVSLLAARSR
ncbi:hypothetical protein [Halorientalis pallida]|uniref:Uncharacterized protein n=1 Tax=Halorientalis pallida TaxID=2479928 RepID=A0A498L6E6_9EURY|nr:hypothetical protein [Halorientalis pallida]RXK51862.1 hypothetical protein EAF64_04305 [Halorientalis pallida]